MATIDPKLLPLIETLIGVDADWLALEILDGLRLGIVAEEIHEDLLSTQLAVREAKRQMRRSEERAVPPPVGKPIVGDEQIDWAARYVSDRLSDAVSMLQASFDQLNQIVRTNWEVHAPRSERTLEKGFDLTLQLEAEGPILRSSEMNEAISAISRLREALFSWADSMKNGGHRT
jgi:hypothetical protein